MVTKTVSEINTFLVCPQFWHHQYVSNRVPRYEAAALTGGKLWHKFIEQVLSGSAPEDVVKALSLEAENAITDLRVAGKDNTADEIETTWTCMLQAAPFYKEQFPGQTLAIETVISRPVGLLRTGEELSLQGIPDRIKLVNGFIVHQQTRTLSGSTPLTPYLKAAQRNLHELVYAWMIEPLYPQPYFGTEMQILLKQKLFSDRKCPRADTKWHTERTRPDCDLCHYEGRIVAQVRQPDEIMSQTMLPIDRTQIADAIADITRVVNIMREIELGMVEPYQNRQADLGKFGNKLCSFFGVCNGEESLMDEELFKKRESRYEESTEA